MLVYSDMILLDLAGPLTAFNIMQADIQLIARSSQAVMTDVGPPVTPTANFETTAKDLDVLFVPGGLKGTIAAMKDTQTVDFVREQGRAARYVTSLHRIASAWSGGAAERLSGHVPLVCPRSAGAHGSGRAERSRGRGPQPPDRRRRDGRD